MNSRRKFLKAGASALALSAIPSSIHAEPTNLSAHLPIKPEALKPGDTIAVTSPAGAVWDAKQVDTFISILKGLGFEVVIGKTLSEKWGYFAGTEELRVNELHTFFREKKIKGIFCMKGGWGCARLLNKLDYELIAANPKVLLGFSDISTLLLAIQHKTGLVTFHGPVGNSGWNEYSVSVLTSVLQNSQPFTFPDLPEHEEPILTLVPGKAEGMLIGGNLSVITNLIGSKYLPEFKNKLLFIEDFKEEPYRIDRMLTHLQLNGVFDHISGLIIGKCNKCVPEEPAKSFTLTEVLQQHAQNWKMPAIYGAMIGHLENKWTVPLGIKASLNATSGKLQLLEAAVK